MDRETFDRLLRQEFARGEAQGRAVAVGRLLGGGFLDAVRAERRVTDAKRLVFADGQGEPWSGRMMTATINPKIAEAEAWAAARRPAAPEELRTVGINANGERQEVVL